MCSVISVLIFKFCFLSESFIQRELAEFIRYIEKRQFLIPSAIFPQKQTLSTVFIDSFVPTAVNTVHLLLALSILSL